MFSSEVTSWVVWFAYDFASPVGSAAVTRSEEKRDIDFAIIETAIWATFAHPTRLARNTVLKQLRRLFNRVCLSRAHISSRCYADTVGSVDRTQRRFWWLKLTPIVFTLCISWLICACMSELVQQLPCGTNKRRERMLSQEFSQARVPETCTSVIQNTHFKIYCLSELSLQ